MQTLFAEHGLMRRHPLRPSRMVVSMSSRRAPCSQMPSVRLGAPRAWLPRASCPWQAAHTAKRGSARATDAATSGWSVIEGRLRLCTYNAMSRTAWSVPPTAAAMGGICPWRPSRMLVRMASALPP